MENTLVSMIEDGLNESHAIIQDVSNPNEINSLFDSISYQKVSAHLVLSRWMDGLSYSACEYAVCIYWRLRWY